MIRIAIAAAAIMACAMAGWSQAYYEASGQTAVFTLAAGAKAGPSAIRSSQPLRDVVASGIGVRVTRSGIIVTLPAIQHGTADIAFYNVAGRQIYRQQSYSGKILRIETMNFKSGIYAVRVCVDGQIYARRFAITAKGE